MRRWILNILAGLSLALFLATITLWVRSHNWNDYTELGWATVTGNVKHERFVELGSLNGKVYAYLTNQELTLRPGQRTSIEGRLTWIAHGYVYPAMNVRVAFPCVLGFGFRIWRAHSVKYPLPWRRWNLGIIFPHWFLALLFAILPRLAPRRLQAPSAALASGPRPVRSLRLRPAGHAGGKRPASEPLPGMRDRGCPNHRGAEHRSRPQRGIRKLLSHYPGDLRSLVVRFSDPRRRAARSALRCGRRPGKRV